MSLRRCSSPFPAGFRCKNFARPDGNDCYRCKMRKWRAANPLRAAYHAVKASAMNRGIEFAISFEYFCKFAKETNYMELKGNDAKALTIDRKDNTKGYVPGNLQPLTRAGNSIKRYKYDQIRYERGYGWRNRC